MTVKRWMIDGAYGYSGKRLAARQSTAKEYTVRQLAPVAIMSHIMNNDAPAEA